MQKILLICLILILMIFNYQIHYGRGGSGEEKFIKDKIKTQLKTNKDLAARNELILLKIEGLKGSNDAMEARARYELNLIKPGEILIKLPSENKELEK